jgi:hypothetical protein
MKGTMFARSAQAGSPFAAGRGGNILCSRAQAARWGESRDGPSGWLGRGRRRAELESRTWEPAGACTRSMRVVGARPARDAE